jgi:hypothetical protein
MAQWIGQYTGNSHATKVQDFEETLRHSITVYRETASYEERFSKRKAIKKLAEKLLNARLKFLKAKLYDAEPVKETDSKKRSSHTDNLHQHLEKVRSEDINGIFKEFDIEDLIED